MSSSDEDELSAPELETLDISNDQYYQPQQGPKFKRPHNDAIIRNFQIPTYGSSTIQHSLPAYDLWRPFFPTFLSDDKLRSFHRPKLRHYNIGPQALTSSKKPKAFPVKNLAKCLYRYQKQLRNKVIKAINNGMTREQIVQNILLIHDACDLTAKQGELFLFEYSEEYPPVLNQLGMASNIKTYIQPGLRSNFGVSRAPKQPLKTSDSSNQQSTEHTEKNGQSTTNVIQDKEQISTSVNTTESQVPMGNYKFGYDSIISNSARAKQVYFSQPKSGSSFTVIENNMYRAPIYQHDMPSCDFLIIRTRNGFYIRTVKTIFTVGQTMPLVAIPQPSKKAIDRFNLDFSNCYIHKLFMDSICEPPVISIDTLQKYFPCYEKSILKRRVSCNGAERESGNIYFRGTSNYGLCSLKELRRRFTPEQYCLYMTMQAARNRLRELNYTESMINPPNADAELETEVLAAPWNTSKAVVSALSGRSYLDLRKHLLDPTGIQREGFSCVNWVKSPTEEQQLKLLQSDPSKCNNPPSTQPPTPFLDKNPNSFKIKQEKLERLAIYQKESRIISDIQSEVLASKETLSSDEDDDDMVDVREENPLDQSFDEQLRDLDRLVNDGRTAKELIFEKEEEERCKMLAEFMQNKNLTNPTEAQSTANTNPTQINVADYENKTLKITRKYSVPGGFEVRSEIVREPKIIALYIKLKSGTPSASQNSNSNGPVIANGKNGLISQSMTNGTPRSPSKRRRSLGPMELCRAEGTVLTISKSVLNSRALRNTMRQARLSSGIS